MHYIEYDDYDLLWLFESEPIDCVGEPLAGIKRYSKSDNKGFELSLRIDTNAKQCGIRLYFNEISVFSADLQEVNSLIKYEENLIISVKDEPTLKLKFKGYLGVKLISEEERERYKDILLDI